MKGQCLCGAIEVSAPDRTEVAACHCNMCRQWGGAPMLAIECGPDVEFSGEQKPAVYRSSDWAERGFCPNCGTHLFYHLLSSDEYVLTPGLFQSEDRFQFTSQIFIDEKPGYYDFANDTETLTGEQVFAQYSGTHE